MQKYKENKDKTCWDLPETKWNYGQGEWTKKSRGPVKAVGSGRYSARASVRVVKN